MITKTNWKATYNLVGDYTGDTFNIADYHRIIANLLELQKVANALYPSITFKSMENKSYIMFFFAEDINALVDNLHDLVKGTYPFIIGEKKVFKANDPFVSFEELNRIEIAIQYIYEQLIGQYRGSLRLSLTCGGGKIAC